MNSQNAICINIQIATPYVTVKKFHEQTGLSESKIRDLIDEGFIPSQKDPNKKRGSVLINLMALAKQAATQA